MQLCALEGVYKSHHIAVGADQDHFAVGRKLQACPLYARRLRAQLEAGEGPFVEGAQVVKFDGFGVDPRRKDEAFRIEGSNWPTDDVHQTLAVL